MTSVSHLLRSRRSLAILAVSMIATVAAAGSVAVAASRTSASPKAATPVVVADKDPSPDQVLAQLSDPKGSGLDAELARQLTMIGVAVVRADVTGIGRDAYPGYWSSSSYTPCCSTIRELGAGARPSITHPGEVEVTTVWDADRADGGPALRHQQSIVRLHQSPNGWQPVSDTTPTSHP
ncbi:MAG: hypothetical protein NVS3B21_07200 [Acidimicrobiales bacterium]